MKEIDIPDGWEKVKLGDLFERVTRKNTNLESENVLTISAQHGLINQEEFFKKSVAGKNLKNYYLLKRGEFAYNKSYSKGYPVGATKILKNYDIGIVSTLYICFRNKSDLVNDKFFEYYFESECYYNELSKIVQEGARNHGLLNVSTEQFFDINIKLPTKEEQKIIATILENVDKILLNIKKEKEYKELLKKGLMQKLFYDYPIDGWELKKLREIGTIITGTTPSTKINEYYSNKYLWVTPSDIKGKEIHRTERMLSEDGLKKGRFIPANSLLVTCIASIGKNTILRENGSCNQQINAIIPNSLYNVEFLYYLLTYNEKILHANAGSGGMEILNREDFSRISFYVPNLIEQIKIANILSKVDSNIDILDRKYNNYKQLKYALMQQLLTGKIQVKI